MLEWRIGMDDTFWSLHKVGCPFLKFKGIAGYFGYVAKSWDGIYSYLPGGEEPMIHRSYSEAAKRIEAVAKEKEKADQVIPVSTPSSPVGNAPKAPSK